MQFKHVASGVAALAMLGLAGASQPAAAHGHSGHGHSGGGGWAPHHAAFAGPHHFAFHHFRHHHFRHHRRFVFVGAYPYYDSYYDDGCTWLRRRARLTGSAYWWHRYNACRDGYDY
jgi:hypothetical protein